MLTWVCKRCGHANADQGHLLLVALAVSDHYAMIEYCGNCGGLVPNPVNPQDVARTQKERKRYRPRV